MTTTVLLVDDHELIRQGLARAFERDDRHVRGRPGRRPSPRRRGLRGSSPTWS